MNLRMSSVLPALFDSLHPTLLPPIRPTLSSTQLTIETGYPSGSVTRDVFTLSDYSSINVVGLGKASLSSLMPFADELVRSPRPPSLRLLCVSKAATSSPAHVAALESADCEIVYGDHPTPTESSVYAAEEVIKLCSEPSSLNLVFLSGGTSSLCCLPSVSLDLYKKITGALVSSSHPIQSINSLRSVLDNFKSGGLAR